VTGAGKRLVTVVLTVAVPAEADAEDAAELVADAAVSTALQVVSAAGVEGHLPVPGSLVLRRDGGQPWGVEAVSKEFATLTDLGGAVVQARLLCRAASGSTTADQDVADESTTGRCLDAGVSPVRVAGPVRAGADRGADEGGAGGGPGPGTQGGRCRASRWCRPGGCMTTGS